MKMKFKNVFFSLGIVVATTGSFTVSCSTFSNSKNNSSSYGELIMNKTSMMSKMLLSSRSENANYGFYSPSYFMYTLNDKDYNGTLRDSRDALEKVNDSWTENRANNVDSIKSTAQATLLTGINGDIETNESSTYRTWFRDANPEMSSIFSYQFEQGPLKTAFESNALLEPDNAKGPMFENSNSNGLLNYTYGRYDQMKSGTGMDMQKVVSYNIDKTTEVYVCDPSEEYIEKGVKCGAKFKNDDGEQEEYSPDLMHYFGKYDFQNNLNWNLMKQLIGLNEVRRLTSFVSSKDNTDDLWMFFNNIFNVNNASNWKIFASLGGTLLYNVYSKYLAGYIFTTAFSDATTSFYDETFNTERKGILDRLKNWYKALIKDKKIDEKKFHNGQYQGTTLGLYSNEYDGDNGGDLINELYNLESEYLSTLDASQNQELTNKIHKAIQAKIGMITSLLPAWSPLIDNIDHTLLWDGNEDSIAQISGKDFILGLLGLYQLTSSNLMNKAASGLQNYAELEKLDLSNQDNYLKAKEALGFVNGAIEKDSVFDRLYQIFNDSSSASYRVMHALFLNDDSAVTRVLGSLTNYVKNDSINAWFDLPTDGIDVNWNFSNPVYNATKKEVTYDVDYTGPGDTDFNYALHEKPIVSKTELSSIKGKSMHTDSNDGYWDYLISKLDGNKSTYDMNWYYSYDGLGQNFSSTKNKYKVVFKNISDNSDHEKWALSGMKWYHNNRQYYDLFE
jgi:hypothetical protein